MVKRLIASVQGEFMLPGQHLYLISFLFITRGRHAFNKVHFFLPVGSSVCSEYIVKPNRWFGCVGFLPAIPRIVCLRFAFDKSPVIHPYFIFFCYRQCILKSTITWPCHIFRTNNGTLKWLQRHNSSFEFFRRIITMKRNDVGVI